MPHGAMFTWPELKNTLSLEQLDTYLFRGISISLGLKRVFGGQVLAQSLNAAIRSVPDDRHPHSLHGYFLRPGAFDRPIIYEVDPIRNGRSFSTRRVVARQNGEAIFNASISFQIPEDGPSHQVDLPDNIPRPEDLISDNASVDALAQTHTHEDAERIRSFFLIFPDDIIELRSPGLTDVLKSEPLEPVNGFWFKFKPDLNGDQIMSKTLLAYISDKALMSTGIRPHAMSFYTHKMMGASLDHAMWFHRRDINVNGWIYYQLRSPQSGHARTFNLGHFYNEAGTLIASTAQEGLFRLRK